MDMKKHVNKIGEMYDYDIKVDISSDNTRIFDEWKYYT